MTTNVYRPRFRAPVVLLVVGVMTLLVAPVLGAARGAALGEALDGFEQAASVTPLAALWAG